MKAVLAVIACALFVFGCATGNGHDSKIVLIPEACLGNGMVTVRRTVTDSVAAAGYVPLILPDTGNKETENKLLDSAAALLIFGAMDGSTDRRPDFEISLVQRAVERKKTIVGFCHGIQIINKALGGTIHRNPTNAEEKVVHHGKVSPYIKETFHDVDIKPGTLIASALGEGKQTVNTSHRYSIDTLAEGFEVTATSSDGVIEAIEHCTFPITAFQFHPERLSPCDPKFTKLIQLALERR